MENVDETFPDEKEALAKEFKELEEIKAREAKSRAVVLEILGDIPDADVKPPKNVLFVCKLNPVTEENDLKIIFSRFGTVNKCDIIKDYVTGDSLQYAFIEFETEDSCNEAYFKMQNVLIDDRRIHVDFCQSVSGFWKKYMNNQTFTKKSSTGGRGSYRHDDRRKYEHKHRNDQHYYIHDKRGEYRREHRKGRSHSRERYGRRSRSHDRRGHRRY